MEIYTKFVWLIIILFYTGCTNSLSDNNSLTESNIDYYSGSKTKLFEVYQDSLYIHPYSILDLERQNNYLKVDVEYSGGEGGCPEHFFILQLDSTTSKTENTSLINLGLAHFLSFPDNCEALVQEDLRFDLTELIEDSLSDTVRVRLTNLVDTTQVVITQSN